MNLIGLVCFSSLPLLFPDRRGLLELNYTHRDLDVSVFYVRAKRSVTQTRLTSHHITLEGPYCGFACLRYITYADFKLLWFIYQRMASVFVFVFFFLSFGFNSCQYTMEMLQRLSRLPITKNNQSTLFFCQSYHCAEVLL